MTETEPTTSTTSWRVTGARRWVPVLLAVSFLLNGLNGAARFLDPDHAPSHPQGLDLFFALVGLAGFLAGAVLVVATLRTRVTLAPTGVEVRVLRRTLVPYADIERAYRDRWTAGAVTLALREDGTKRLPAPVSSLRGDGAEVDEAVDLIRARIAGGRATPSG